jgi:hypothetical protein
LLFIPAFCFAANTYSSIGIPKYLIQCLLHPIASFFRPENAAPNFSVCYKAKNMYISQMKDVDSRVNMIPESLSGSECFVERTLKCCSSVMAAET